jgi:hypothetical protein
MRNAYKILVWKSERKKLLGNPRCNWEDSINMVLKEIQYDGALITYISKGIPGFFPKGESDP